jgi:hypothetical protein
VRLSRLNDFPTIQTLLPTPRLELPQEGFVLTLVNFVDAADVEMVESGRGTSLARYQKL